MDEVTLSLSPEAITYSWQQLLQRAGCAPPEVPLWYAHPSQAPIDFRGVIVVPCAATDFSDLLQRSPGTLPRLPLEQVLPSGARSSFVEPIPVLFGGAGRREANGPFAQLLSNDRLVFYADIIAATFFMLSRWEETVVPTRDEHGRFPATASVAYKQGFLDRPIVDEYALILREWLRVLLPNRRPKPDQFSVKLSHDMDRLRRFRNFYTAARAAGSALIKRRSPRLAWRTTRQAIVPSQDPYLQGLSRIVTLSVENGLGNDAFYFMTTEPGPDESNYHATSRFVRRWIDRLRAQGFEIGLHAGYHTFKNPTRLAEEKAQLDAILGTTRYGGRQHFLRFQAPDTWRDWEQAGLTYDSTMAYADHEGFRCGTCHSFRPFDVELDRELDLWEQPLVVMDTTLRHYRHFTPPQGERRILELARRCQRVGGTFTLLWHNSSFTGKWLQWAAVYPSVVTALASMAK